MYLNKKKSVGYILDKYQLLPKILTKILIETKEVNCRSTDLHTYMQINHCKWYCLSHLLVSPLIFCT